MSNVHFVGAKLNDETKADAMAQLSERVRVVLVPVADSATLPNPWLRFPKAIAWLVADLFDWTAVVSRDPVSNRKLHDDPLESGLANAFGRGEVLVLDAAAAVVGSRLPSLSPSEVHAPPWVRDTVEGIDDVLGQPVRSKTDLIALQAGILQMGDYLTPSHEHSQSIEGRGKRRAGDYWHAINHRREPDYGNAKYWFRHVGNHPLLADLANVIPELAREFSAEIQSRAEGLVDGGRLDPFRFVDLVSEACRGRNAELTRFAERVQWLEMVGLLEATLRDAVG